MYRIKELLRQKKPYYHTQDLAVAWGINNRNTLYKTISRYIKGGVLKPAHKGFYTTLSLDEIDPVELGVGFLHTFAYLSCESILAAGGIINQNPEGLTLVSSVSKTFNLAGRAYKVRRLSDEFLANNLGLVKKGDHFEASPERAVADLLYYNPKYFIDNKSLVDWVKVKAVQKEVYHLW